MSQAAQDIGDAVNSAIAEFVRMPFTSASDLAEIGLDSLSIIRIVADVLPDADQEIDAGELADLRTVGQLQDWLGRLVAPGSAR
ncbi:phosphopantetheine-binding protein [Streptomyces apocyni]|uniref:phosphopantetheine-binding protein n=1 Tax=Streptomyces apocyni TaxID=2654677 RepID=UPI0018D1CD53|nr:phosphopantetheine-binding protein [Streptomyces apocyni]